MSRSVLVVPVMALLGSVAVPQVQGADITNAQLERRFTQNVRPFLTKYCIGCHGGSSPAAMFDLRPYSTMASVLNDFPHWALILNRLNANEMPPKVAPQAPPEVKQQVIDWIQAVRASEAKRTAGDPGAVLVRRLSNSEYNNTIRDLTGVDMRPTREFPVDPANTSDSTTRANRSRCRRRC